MKKVQILLSSLTLMLLMSLTANSQRITGGGSAIEQSGGVSKRSTITVNAQLDGTVASGRLSYEARVVGFKVEVDVNCITFVPLTNNVIIGGTVTSVTGGADYGFTVGGFATIQLQDNGNGKGSDKFGDIFPLGCSDSRLQTEATFPPYQSLDGNFSIHK